MYEQQLKVQNFSFVQDHWLDKSHELRGKKKTIPFALFIHSSLLVSLCHQLLEQEIEKWSRLVSLLKSFNQLTTNQ